MAGFGSVFGSAGYRGPTASIRGPARPPYPSSKVVGSGRSGGALGGGFPGSRSKMPRYRAPAQRAPQGAGGVGGATSSFTMPPPTQYQPAAYKPQVYDDPNLGVMAGYGKGMLDPQSDYYKRLSAGMQRQIGARAEAQQRAAALRGAWGGLGGGRGGEVMATAADIGRAGLEAQGVAEADLRLQAPMAGAQMLQSTFGPQLGYHQLTEGGRQFGAQLSAQERQFAAQLARQQQQFGVGVGVQQQMFGGLQAWQQAQLQHQAAMQAAQMQHEAQMQAAAAAYSGLG